MIPNKTAIFTQLSPNKSSDMSNLELPIARQGHVSILYENKEMYIFSGRIPKLNYENKEISIFNGRMPMPNSCRRTYIEDFWKFDIQTRKWIKLDLIKGKSPSERHSHSAVLYKNEILIFGGSNNDKYLGELWCYNINNMEWNLLTDNSEENPSLKYCPSARHGHSATIYQNLMIIIAGKFGYNSNAYFNDVYAFDIDKKNWINFETKNNEAIKPRCWHTCTLLKNMNNLFLFGGFRIDKVEGEVYYNDSWALDMKTLKWKEITNLIDGISPHKRNRHVAVYLEHLSKDNSHESVFLHSGNYMEVIDQWLDDAFVLEIQLSPLKFRWDKLYIDNSLIGKNLSVCRGQHTANYKSDSNEILVFGGEFERIRFNDLISIKI